MLHQLDINGPIRGLIIWLATALRRLVQPHVRRADVRSGSNFDKPNSPR